MKLIFESETLPGINDANIDFIFCNNNMYILHNGNKIPFEQWPEWVIILLNMELSKNESAKLALDDLGLSDATERLKTFTCCNYGGYDNKPDLQAEHFNPEYWNCGHRGNCKYEGRLCKFLSINGQTITPREIQVIQHIESGLQDKEIAETLGISENTVKNHRSNIAHKLGLQNRTEISHFAHTYNLVKR